MRVHSECLTGDVLGSLRCDCGPQLQQAMQQIADAGRGVLVYMRQEGRGIGLAPKIQAYKLQEKGYDTVEANLKLGFPHGPPRVRHRGPDPGGPGAAEDPPAHEQSTQTRGTEGHGLEITGRFPDRVSPNRHNRRYLKTKREKLGHLL